MDLAVESVISIVVITYLVGLAVKAIKPIDNKFIPVIVGVVGGLLGVLGLYVIPDYPANNILDAIAVGIASGLASTGVNQIYKQLSAKE